MDWRDPDTYWAALIWCAVAAGIVLAIVKLA